MTNDTTADPVPDTAGGLEGPLIDKARRLEACNVADIDPARVEALRAQLATVTAERNALQSALEDAVDPDLSWMQQTSDALTRAERAEADRDRLALEVAALKAERDDWQDSTEFYRHALDLAGDENAALRAMPHSVEVWECADCGIGVSADEDGCCATCGRDCTVISWVDGLARIRAAALSAPAPAVEVEAVTGGEAVAAVLLMARAVAAGINHAPYERAMMVQVPWADACRLREALAALDTLQEATDGD